MTIYSNVSRALLCTTTALCTCFIANAAWAQATSNQKAKTVAGLEQVIVTAEKRSQDIQQVPVAINALSPDALQRAGVKEFDQLDKLLPDVQVNRVVSMPVISIRGIFPTDLGPTSETPTAVNIDGAYIAKFSGIGGMFFDIARIEVLKGPQGTLYGRNAAAGAVNIITNRPTQDYGGHGEFAFGNYNMLDAEGSINIPLNDTLAMRAAFRSYSHDGYYTNGLGDDDEKGGRLEFLWKPTERQQLLLTADYEKLGGKGQVMTIDKYIIPPAPVGSVVPPHWDVTPFFGKNPPFYYRSREFGLMAQYDYSMDWATWTVQASHRRQISKEYAAEEPPPEVAEHVGNFNSYSLETRLTSASTNPWQWVVGLFAFEDKDDGYLSPFANVNATTPLVTFNNFFERAESYAAFGQTTYTPPSMQQLHLTLGLRYSIDHKKAITFTQFGTNPSYPIHRGSHTWTSPTYRVAVRYDLTPTSNVYASVATGYKSGGYAFGQDFAYNPEHIMAYEVGSKNTFLNHRLQLNASAYYYSYKDFETVISYNAPGTSIRVITVTNAGRATFYGTELSALYAVTDNDTLQAHIAAESAKYDSFDLRPINPQLYNLSNTRVPQTPPFTANLSYDHMWNMWGGSFDAQVSTELRARTMMVAYGTNTPNQVFVYDGPWSRTDLSLRFTPDDSKWNITGYVHNVGDTYSFNRMFYNYNLGHVGGSVMDPRTFGVRVSADF